MAKLEIPIIIKCTEIDELIDEIKHLQTYKLFEGDEQTLIDRDDTIEIFAKHIRASAQPEQTTEMEKQDIVRTIEDGIVATSTKNVYSCGMRNGQEEQDGNSNLDNSDLRGNQGGSESGTDSNAET